MHVIRQYDPSVDGKGMIVLHLADDVSQSIDMPDQQIVMFPLL
jgi:hypothetical protein